MKDLFRPLNSGYRTENRGPIKSYNDEYRKVLPILSPKAKHDFSTKMYKLVATTFPHKMEK